MAAMDENRGTDLSESLYRDKLPAPEYGEKYQEHLLEQYKLYVQMADKISERRQSANTFFLTINTVLIAFLGIVGKSGIVAQADPVWRGEHVPVGHAQC